MTDEEINIAVAESCGFLVIQDATDLPNDWEGAYFTPAAADQHFERHPFSTLVEIVPDYANDLNVMHEAEGFLRGKDWAGYFDLIQKTGAASGVRATARQRAEAFLRTLGKWRD